MRERIRRILVLTAVVAITLTGVVEAQTRQGTSMVGETQFSVHLGMPGDEAGWGEISYVTGRNRSGMTESIDAVFYNLAANKRFGIEVAGTMVASFVSDEFGDAVLSIDDISSNLPAFSGSMKDALLRAALVDADGVAVLSGDMAKNGEDTRHTVYLEGILLDDLIGMGAEGRASVARLDTGAQIFRGWAIGLEPLSEYSVFVDGYLAKVGTTDEEGRGRMILISDDPEHPLPKEMQPIEDIRIVEVTDINGITVLAGAFTGDPGNAVAMRGRVTLILDDGFEVLHDDEIFGITVSENTTWRGELESLADLVVDMGVMIAGEWTDEGVVDALVVAGRTHPEPARLRGEVLKILGNSFDMLVGEETLRVRVDDDTKWLRGLTGLEDLEVGTKVGAAGFWNEDGSLNAIAVALDEQIEPLRLSGEVSAIGTLGFDLLGEDGQSVVVVVTEDTRWFGALESLSDLVVGMRVLVAGVWAEDGSFTAFGVASDEHPDPVRAAGEVVTIETDAFSMMTPENDVIDVLVGENTRWIQGLEGFADLVVGAKVVVGGVWDEDGAFLAFVVALDPRVEPLRLVGAVTEIFADGFGLETDEGVMDLTVSELTRFMGGLGGLEDLFGGMLLFVAAAPDSTTGNLIALAIAPAEGERVQIVGRVISVESDGFTIDHEGSPAIIIVNDHTIWRGSLEGLEDVVVDLKVLVLGIADDDDTINAVMVASR